MCNYSELQGLPFLNCSAQILLTLEELWGCVSMSVKCSWTIFLICQAWASFPLISGSLHFQHAVSLPSQHTYLNVTFTTQTYCLYPHFPIYTLQLIWAVIQYMELTLPHTSLCWLQVTFLQFLFLFLWGCNRTYLVHTNLFGCFGREKISLKVWKKEASSHIVYDTIYH